MKKFFSRYKGFILVLVINILLFLFSKELGMKSIKLTGANLLEMLQVLPPVMILLGLMDIWVPREVMIKYMGDGSGLLGVTIAILLGSFAAGPLYVAFPIALMLMKKGSKFSNVLIFIGAWSTTKVPMLLFEAASLGWKFALTRLAVDLIGVVVIGYVLELFAGQKEKETIYNAASLAES